MRSLSHPRSSGKTPTVPFHVRIPPSASIQGIPKVIHARALHTHMHTRHAHPTCIDTHIPPTSQQHYSTPHIPHPTLVPTMSHPTSLMLTMSMCCGSDFHLLAHPRFLAPAPWPPGQHELHCTLAVQRGAHGGCAEGWPLPARVSLRRGPRAACGRLLDDKPCRGEHGEASVCQLLLLHAAVVRWGFRLQTKRVKGDVSRVVADRVV